MGNVFAPSIGCPKREGGTDEFKLIVVGETGSGKTSFVNLLANFEKFMYVNDWSDTLHYAPEVCFGIFLSMQTFINMDIELTERKARGESQTDVAFPYDVIRNEFKFTVIDTPGFGDTRGMRQDEKNSKSILHCIKEEEYLNCVCLVVNGKQERVSSQLKYVLDQIATQLPKAVLNQILIVFTNCPEDFDRQTPLEEIEKHIGMEVKKERVIHIDNPVAQVLRYKEVGHSAIRKRSNKLREDFNATRNVLLRAFDEMQKYPQVPTLTFMDVFQTKQEIETQACELMSEYEQLSEAMDRHKQLKVWIETGKAAMEQFKTSEVRSIWNFEETEGSHNMICDEPGCHSNCHLSCNVPFTLKKGKYQGFFGCQCFSDCQREVKITCEEERSKLLKNVSRMDCVLVNDSELQLYGERADAIGTCADGSEFEIGDVLLGGQGWSYYQEWLNPEEDILDKWKNERLPFTKMFRVNDWGRGDSQKCGVCGHALSIHRHSARKHVQREETVETIKPDMMSQFEKAKYDVEERESLLKSVSSRLASLREQADDKARELVRNLKRLEKISMGRNLLVVVQDQVKYVRLVIDRRLVKNPDEDVTELQESLRRIEDLSAALNKAVLSNGTLRDIPFKAGETKIQLDTKDGKVLRVCNKSSAAKMGVRCGWIVMKINNERYNEDHELAQWFTSGFLGLKRRTVVSFLVPALLDDLDVDIPWGARCAELLGNASLPKTVEEATKKLRHVGVDVNLLMDILDSKRNKFKEDGIPDSFIELALAIHANTLAVPPVFQEVAGILRDANQRVSKEGEVSTKVMHCIPYTKMLDVAVKIASPLEDFKGTAYRGVKYTFADLEAKFKVGCTVCWYEYKSVTYDTETLLTFCGFSGPRTIYQIHDFVGRKIEKVSAFPEECELLAPCLSLFQVEGVRRGSQGYGSPLDTADIVFLRMKPAPSERDWKEELQQLMPIPEPTPKRPPRTGAAAETKDSCALQ